MQFLRALPFLLLYKRSPAKDILEKDVAHWVEQLAPFATDRPIMEKLLIFLHMEHVEEFRDLLYYRIGTPDDLFGRILLDIVKRLYKPRGSIRIETSSIAPGILIMHGVGTVIQADRIGKHLLIFQEVIIAPKMDGLQGRPVIGDDVRISAGAKILGAVTIGDGSIIGPNAVVTKDVPPRNIAIGIPARNVPMDRDRKK